MIDPYQLEGVVMHGYYMVAFQEAGCLNGIVNTHGEVVANGQKSQRNFALPSDQLHVHTQSRITCMIKGTLRGVDEKASGIASVAAIGQGTRMNGIHVLHFSKIKFPATTDIHRVHILHAFLFEPGGNLEIADHRGSCPLRDALHICDMVIVSVTYQYIICRYLIHINICCQRIFTDEGIE